jgi:AcrR family transcriptional regulator
MPYESNVESSTPHARPTRRRPGRERLVAAMDRLLYRDGLSSAVVDNLITEAHVARGTLYKNFETRDDLIEAYLEGRHQQAMTVLEQIAADGSPLQHQVDAVFDHLANLTGDELFRGCAFVVAAAELPEERRPATKWARLHKRVTFETFHKIFASHGTPDPETRAEQLSILYDGALITSYLRPASDAVQRAREMAHRLLLP